MSGGVRRPAVRRALRLLLTAGVAVGVAAALAVGLAGVPWSGIPPAFAQDNRPRPHPAEEGIADFLGGPTVFLLLFTVGGTMAWAVWRARRRKSTLPIFDDETFETEVLQNRMPVLVHFSRHWNVANKAAVSQTELLAWKNRGAVVVGLLEMDACPRTMERFPGMEPPAYVLFHRGRKLFHRWGLQQAEEIQKEIDLALSREGF